MDNKPPCAWCLKERGEKPKFESHGICERHESEMFQSIKSIKQLKGELQWNLECQAPNSALSGSDTDSADGLLPSALD